MFITFEGIDGSGKTTQLEQLAQILKQQGKNVLVTRDPGGTELGRELRCILLHHPGHIVPISELLLYVADRAQHVEEVIRPALAQGKIVLCDRFTDSTVAYQGGGRGLSIPEIQHLNALATDGLKPDFTFLFDAPVELLLRRTKNRGESDRLEQEDIEFYERVRNQYLAIAAAEPNRIKILDASTSITVLQQQLLTSLDLKALA